MAAGARSAAPAAAVRSRGRGRLGWHGKGTYEGARAACYKPSRSERAGTAARRSRRYGLARLAVAAPALLVAEVAPPARSSGAPVRPHPVISCVRGAPPRLLAASEHFLDAPAAGCARLPGCGPDNDNVDRRHRPGCRGYDDPLPDDNGRAGHQCWGQLGPGTGDWSGVWRADGADERRAYCESTPSSIYSHLRHPWYLHCHWVTAVRRRYIVLWRERVGRLGDFELQ